MSLIHYDSQVLCKHVWVVEYQECTAEHHDLSHKTIRMTNTRTLTFRFLPQARNISIINFRVNAENVKPTYSPHNLYISLAPFASANNGQLTGARPPSVHHGFQSAASQLCCLFGLDSGARRGLAVRSPCVRTCRTFQPEPPPSVHCS